MEKKQKVKTTSNIPKGESGTKKKKEYSKLIPLHISAAKQAYFLPEQNKKNTIYINDLETLNESSFTNNFECLSNKDMQSFGDSLSLIHSRQGSKTDLFEDRSKKISLQKYQEELFKKEKENNLLKKEITDLQNNNSKLKEQEILNQKRLLKLNESYKNLEQLLNNIKKEFGMKEKDFSKQIEQFKNDINNKDSILKSLQEKILYKNKLIDNLNHIIKEKDLQINELNKKLKKNKYLKRNFDININSNINNNINNYSYLNSNKENKENENYNNMNNIKINKSNCNQENQKNMNLKEFMRRYKIISKIKDQIQGISPSIDNKSKKNIVHQHLIRNESAYLDQGPPKQIKNYNFIEESKGNIPKKSIKDISLKKQLKLTNKMIFKIKHNKNRIKNNENNSMKNISNFLLDRNYYRKYSNISCFSYTNRINNCETSPVNKKLENNYSNNNLIKERISKEVFLKRLYKNNKKVIKTSISDSTNSNLYSDIDNSKNYYHQKTNIENKSSDYLKKNSTNNNIIREHFYRGSLKNIQYINQNYKKVNDNTPQNRRKFNNQINDLENKKDNISFLNEMYTENNEKNNHFIQGQFRYKRPSLIFSNSIIDSSVNLTNKNKKSIKLSVRSVKTKDSNSIKEP